VNGEATEWQLVFAGLRDGDLRLLVVALAVLGMTLAVISTRRQIQAGGARAGLIALRWGAIILAAAWLFEPVLVRRNIEMRPSLVPVLVDVSASMKLADGQELNDEAEQVWTRASTAAGLMDPEGDLLRELQSGGDREVVVHGFGGELFDEYERGQALAEDTAPADALRATLARYRGRPTAAVVMITDGRQTVGGDAAAAAAEAAGRQIPVIVVTTGSETGPKTVRVADLSAPERALAGEAFMVEATVTANGVDGQDGRLIIESRRGDDAWQEVSTIDLQFSGNLATVQESVPMEPQRSGKLYVRARFEGENASDDAPPVRTVDVMPERLRVLLVAGSTFPEVQFLRTALIRDQRVMCASWLLDADSRYRNPGNVQLEQLPQTMAALDDWDCVVLYDPDPGRWPLGWGELLYRFVAERGGGLVFVAGAQRTATLLDEGDAIGVKRDWRRLLPVVREPGEYRADLMGMLERGSLWRMELTQAGRESEVFRFLENPEENTQLLRDLPGMYWHLPVTRERPGAVVLARHGDERMRNRHGQHVILATQLFGPGRTWFVGVDSIYRWRYLGEEVYSGFWARMLSSAARGRLLGGGPVRLSVSPGAVPGAPVRIEASFRGAEDAAMNTGGLVVELESPAGEKRELPLSADGESFVGSFVPETGGTWFARITTGEDGAAAALQQFDVRPPARELRDQSADFSFGRVVASQTAGFAVEPLEAVSAAAELTMRRVEHVTEERRALWDKWPYFGLLFLLIFAEWTWRKALRQP
jgi:hypothetical protein